MSQFYKAAAVDPILTEVMEVMHAAVLEGNAQEKRANELSTQLAALRAQTPASAEVRTEKLAFAKADIDAATSALVDNQLLRADEREKFAKKLSDNPESALRVIYKLASMQAGNSAAEIGRGIKPEIPHTKKASTFSDDGWDKLENEGA